MSTKSKDKELVEPEVPVTPEPAPDPAPELPPTDETWGERQARESRENEKARGEGKAEPYPAKG